MLGSLACRAALKEPISNDRLIIEYIMICIYIFDMIRYDMNMNMNMNMNTNTNMNMNMNMIMIYAYFTSEYIINIIYSLD